MAIKAGPNPNQGDLFVSNEQTGTVQVAQEALPKTTSDVSPGWEDGVSVDLLDRNARLQNTLRRLGVMSRTVGLQIAAESGRRPALEGLYDDVDRVVGNAVERSGQKHTEAKQEYAKAFGLQQIIDSGEMSAEEAKAMARKSYDSEVLPLFADSKGAGNRNAMKRWLNYQERAVTGKTTRRPKISRPSPTKVV